MTRASVYLVEDNENVREALAVYLRLEGMSVEEFGEIAAAEAAIERGEPDCVILDVMLPDGDGFLLAQRIRSRWDVPLLFLTARAQESDRITGLELGADDYIVKPFSPKEVVLRVKAILRRGRSAGSSEGRPRRYRLGDAVLEVDEAAHRLAVGGADLDLTAAEWTILLHLAEGRTQVFSRLQLLDACLGSIAEASERTIDTHVKNIRRKLGDEGWIVTVRGFGYRFGGVAM